MEEEDEDLENPTGYSGLEDIFEKKKKEPKKQPK